METWDAIRARRNVRQYTGEPIARETLARILEAGRRAPSSQNWQPWHFVVVTGRDQQIELTKAWERGGRHIAQSAATIALVASEPEDQRHRDWLLYDFGQATAFMMPPPTWASALATRRSATSSKRSGYWGSPMATAPST
jgi:nitroreductase